MIKTTFQWGQVANWGLVTLARTPVKSMDIWGHFWLVIGISLPYLKGVTLIGLV